jgi:hypothetical protein
MSCFDVARLAGLSRVARPPASTMPFIDRASLQGR